MGSMKHLLKVVEKLSGSQAERKHLVITLQPAGRRVGSARIKRNLTLYRRGLLPVIIVKTEEGAHVLDSGQEKNGDATDRTHDKNPFEYAYREHQDTGHKILSS
jgi:hypothetical protein